MKVSQDPVSLYELLTKYQKLIVPRYQREYSWDNEQFSDLFRDISDADPDFGHFFGSLLFYCEDDNKKPAEIIDGQQRITTFFLLLNSLKNAITDLTSNKKLDKKVQIVVEKSIEKINNCLFAVSKKLKDINQNQVPRLETGKRDNKLFSEIIKGRDHKNVIEKSLASHKLILKASQVFFSKQLQEIQKESGIDGLIDFLDKIFESKFIIMTAEKDVDKVLLFKTLNARGLELAQSDLIKNEICKTVNEDDIDEAIDIWDEIKIIIEKANGNIDSFLFHFLNSQTKSKELRKNLEIRKGNNKKISYAPIVPEKFVFEIFELLLKDTDDIFELMNEINTNAENYSEFLTPNKKSKAYANLIGLKALNITKCYPLLLAGKNTLNEKDFAKLANAIEVISFRHSILKEDPKELEKLYYSVLDEISKSKNVALGIQLIQENSTMKRNAEFNENFLKASPKSITSKYVLYRITRYFQEAIEWGTKDIHLEHVMPQKPSGMWLKYKKENPDKYDEYLSRVGNLTLLQDKLNQSASNKDFKTKNREYYVKSRLTLTKDSFKKYKSWGYDQIEGRQKELLSMVNKIWKI
jgi:uncharacterized protein with ParB-like and HNH nuclease domain